MFDARAKKQASSSGPADAVTDSSSTQGKSDASPGGPQATVHLRDEGEQRRYREKSSSTQKDKKHTAHKIDLELVTRIRDAYGLPHLEEGSSELAEVKKFLNASQNFRMVLSETNQKLHREVVHSLVKIATEKYHGVLPYNHAQRMQLQAKFLQRHGKDLADASPTTFEALRNAYLKAKVSDTVSSSCWVTETMLSIICNRFYISTLVL